MNTRKYPRTMREAFGPYTSHDLEPMPDKSSKLSYLPAAVAVISWLLLILL